MTQTQLLDELIAKVALLSETASEHRALDVASLAHRPHDKAWNALECYEHMCGYDRVYGRYISDAIESGLKRSQDLPHRPGIIGGWSVKAMRPDGPGPMRTMKTFASKDPMGDQIESLIIDEFISHQQTMSRLLSRCADIDLTKSRCRIDIPIIRFTLGDALSFIIEHDRRHIAQAERALTFS